MGVTTVVLASGGMSHYPGTERYAAPDLDWDRAALARIAAGNLKSLVGYDAAELDTAGNVELSCWACAAGALGECKPEHRFAGVELAPQLCFARLVQSASGAARTALPVDQARTRRIDRGTPRSRP